MNTTSISSNKQRGVYSEIINPDNSALYHQGTLTAQDQSFYISTQQRQNIPKANPLKTKSNFSSIVRQNQKRKTMEQLQRIAVKIGQDDDEFDMKVEPKVMQPYDPIPGRVPRKVAIDRKKKQYAAFNLDQLLKDNQIDFTEERRQSWLPLEYFDDTTYDDYADDGWITKKIDEDGNTRKLTGKGLRKIESNYQFQPIEIVDYIGETKKYKIIWKKDKKRDQIHRLYFCFDAEDPRKYISRVVNAFEQRYFADSIIRYEFYIDNMPIHNADLPELDQEQKRRLQNLAKTKKLKEMECTTLLMEVGYDYSRTMNKIIFNKYIQDHMDEEPQLGLILPPKKYDKTVKKQIPEYGMIQLDKPGAQNKQIVIYGKTVTLEDSKDFEETFKSFCFHSLFIKQQVVRAIQDIRVKCNEILQMKLFETELKKSVQLQQFRSKQQSCINYLLYHLKGAWIEDLIKVIKSNFAKVGKGWFNMQQTSKITYDFGKLKRFLTVVRLMMQDTVLSVVKKQFMNFKDYVFRSVPKKVKVLNVCQIINEFISDEQAKNMTSSQKMRQQKKFYQEPLFLLNLVKSKQDDFGFSVNPQNFVKMIVSICQKPFQDLGKIPDLQPKILSDLYKAIKNEAFIKAPIKPREEPIDPDPNLLPRKLPDENKWIWFIIQDIRQQMEKAIQPLYQYKQSWQQYIDLLRMDPDQYARKIEMDDSPWQVDQIQAQIAQIQKKEKMMREKLPETIQVSIFQINCKQMKETLSQKYQNLQKNLIDMIAKKAKSQSQVIFANFQMMQAKLKDDPKDIEKLTDIKDYIASLPIQLEKMKLQMTKCFDIYKILEDFNYRFSKDELDKKWNIFGSPKQLNELVEKRVKQLDKKKVKFLQEMKLDQEDFKDTIDGLQKTIINFHTWQDIKSHQSVAKSCIQINKSLAKLKQHARQINSRQNLFDEKQTDYSKIDTMIKQFAPYSNLWITSNSWFENVEKWNNGAWQQLDAVAAEKFVQQSIRIFGSVIRFFKQRDIQAILKIAQAVKAQLDQFRPKVPLMVALRKKGMVDRHWDQISEKVGFPVKPDENFTFGKVIQMGLMKNSDICVQIGQRASKQYNIQMSLKQMTEKWEQINFNLASYKNTFLIRNYQDIQQVLDQHIVNTQSMQFSPFKKPFQQQIIQWNNKLKTMSDVLEQWAKCQGQWMYLQPIFDSADIAKQLVNEYKKFKTVDSTWRHTMDQASKVIQVLQVCSQDGLLERLQQANKNLEIIQKELRNYLQKKREVFARFYFLSDTDLLQILSQTKEPLAVQPHLKKVFENINEVQFNSDKKILAMYSAEKEKVSFVKHVDPVKKNVEDWMNQLQAMMRMSVRQSMINAVQDYPKKKRRQWSISHPGQVILNGSQIIWTNDVEKALKTGGVQGVKQYWQVLNNYLIDLVQLVRTKLETQAKVTINALIVIDVHAKDIVEKLWKMKISDSSAFEWISQLRYYWTDDCYVKCIQTNFPYGYQYLGNTLRLVITPLTDKCYMTLMGALKLNMGGAPAGPAGTGKTQSVKDLAKALAKQCVVFNCSDSMDYIMIGKFFKGLASAGAWCCFDEFNRINIQVLSVIAQQLLILFGQKAKGTPIIEFQKSTIKLLPTFCVFITMNPGYAGRTQLPDNLKALFRAVAMMVPDYAMIGQIMLYSFGFTKGRALAQKMVATFKLSSEQLSSQDHYDYGMRAVRSVINAAGLLKSADPDMDEEQLLLRALRDVNVPKFLKDDLPLFQNIIKDLFPGVSKPQIDYGKLNQYIGQTCKKMILQQCAPFLEKVSQLYDTIQVRHGLMLVGPTGGGKTSVYKVLSSAMSSLGKDTKQPNFKVHLHVLNPKSIKIPSQLYGDYNESTHEWSDGILAYTVRQCVKDQSIQRHWIMFDGPVDSLWIQSMNTVLDDNKKLCLNSGQILTLTPHMTMMFEVQDLAVASPATVSRCGMVYIQPQALGTKVLFDSWIQKIPENIKNDKKIMKKIIALLDTFVEPVTRQLRLFLKEVVTTMDNNICQSLMRILDSFFVPFTQTEIKKITPQQMSDLGEMIEQLFLFSFIWSFCCTTDYDGRKRLNQVVRDLIKTKTSINFPQNKTIYSYLYNQQTKSYLAWEQTNKSFMIDPKLLYHEIMIPTSDSARNIYFLKLLITNQKHVLNVGPTGTGKSLNVSQLLNKQLTEAYQYISMVFSAQTGCNQTQDTIDAKLDKLRKGVYGPPIGQKCVIFVDDLNMPKKEQFGAQPPIELLRQYMDHKGWYNRKDLQFMRLQRLVILAAMGPPGGGRTFITPRLIRHFNVIAYTQLDKQTIQSIFSSLVNHFYKKFTEDVKNMIPKIIESVLSIYDKVRIQLLPTPSKSHYTFNLRDIWRVFQGMCSASSKFVVEVKDLIKLWYHENMRVFHDRLTTNQDREYLKKKLGNIIKQFGCEEEQIIDVERILFGDFTQNRQSQNKPYIQIQDLSGLVLKMDSFQQQYNNDISFIIGGPRKSMKLVMFLDACQHITRIARIIRQPQGNALVLGVGGSGRQSLSRIATYLTGYKLFQIQVTKSYNMKVWREDIKKALMIAGLQNKPISFLFCDTQIISQQMLEDVNNILNSGDVTGIYQEKDYEQITTMCKGDCIKKNIPPTKANIFTQYLIRVKRNIHMIIVMSPLSNQFSTRLRMFPSLINCSTIDWFTQWPQEALLNVGKGQLVDDQQQLGIAGKLSKLVQMFKSIHKSVQKMSDTFLLQLNRHNYVTPTSYLELLIMYKQVLGQKRKEVGYQTNRLRSGLQKLQSANKQVQQMKIQLRDMQPQLQKKNKQVGELMEQLTRDKQEAKKQQAMVAQQEQKATQQANKAKALADEAQRQCSDAQKQLDQTLEKVKQLKKQHLNEIKGFTSPKQAVVTVCAGLVILFWDWIMANGGQIIYQKQQPGATGKKEENYFQMCKRFLMKDLMGLIKMIQLYDRNNITDKAMERLKNRVIFRPQFEFQTVARCSFAAKFLQMWVKCMYQYNIVYTQTQPLRKQLAILKKQVEEKQAYLRKKKAELEEINNKIQILMKRYDDSMRQQEQLKNKIQQCQIKLQRAQKLTQGLSQEKVRWASDIKLLEKRMDLLPGDSIISAGMVAYSGPFTSTYREQLEKQWQTKLKEVQLDHTQGITMRGFLGQPVKIQAWNIAQLPKDDNSTENGIIIDKTRRWPLMIDPQNQANKFIKNLSKEHQQGIDVIKLGENLMRTIQLAVQYGKWVLLENVQKELDASLDPILAQQVTKSSGSDSGIIQIGEKSLAYNNAFKFFMTTTLPNPHYSPETFVKVTIINFAITPSGLEEQMLAQIVTVQNPNLEQKKTEIVKKNAADKKQLLNIEDSILKSLSETKGGINQILMDQTLINKLQSSKKFAAEINQRVKDSKITQAEIDKARQSYRPVAKRASLLYFCILDLSIIDPMYQYSLQWFSNLFLLGLQNSPPSNVLEQRLKSMNDYFTYSLYENICRSLFQKHKLIFSFMLTTKILFGDQALDPIQFRYLLTGPSADIKIPSNPTSWISENAWPTIYKQMNGMSVLLPAFKGIDEYFLEKSDQFKHIFDSNNAHQQQYPQYWQEKLTSFQKMIFLKALRSDKVVPAIQNWITQKMGERFIISPTFDLGKCFKDSTIQTPLIFVLSAGSDPVADFLKFAQQSGMGKRIESISLGQGQGEKAYKLVIDNSQKGGWVLLQNCHLATSWMPSLEKLVQQLHDNMHKDFRLWLTSMPSVSFPISVLQNGVKMTIQPPQGIRANLLRTYNNLSDQQLKDCKKPTEFKKMLFGFCLFHAIIQDRRKFGPIGWNIAYQFTNQDLTVCKKQLKMLLDEYDAVPYKVINFLGAQINYGGRVTDDKDVRLIKTILKNYINTDVMKDGSKFSKSGIYVSIQAGNLQSYINYISSLPLNPAPEAFGLHDNAQITNAQNQTRLLLETILSVQPKTVAGTGKSRQQVIEQIAIFVQKRSPKPWIIEDVYKLYPTLYKESMNTVLIQELIRYNRLLQIISDTIKNAKKALKGLIVMSDELQSLCNSLFDNQVPKVWADVGFLSMKPLGSWVQDLTDRVNFLQKWIDNGTPNVFWISGFFFPQAFITGTLQNYARKHIVAVDRVFFQYRVLDNMSYTEVTQKPQDGCYIYGIYLEGARWDFKKHLIGDPYPKQLFSDLPMMHLYPIVDRQAPIQGVYNCPLYKVESRRGTLSTTGHSTNFVMYVELPSKQQQDIWIRGGVAAFLSLRY